MQEPTHDPVRFRPAVERGGPPPRAGEQPLPPVPISPILGREAEIDAARALLSDPAVRLLTLTGPGGVGKTRLALHIASLVEADSSTSTWFVPLAAVRDPSQVVPAIASGLGIRETLQVSPAAEIARRLGNGATLLVLDNMEQVIDSALDVADLLSGLPTTTILVTSREPLRVAGEHVLPVPCLKSPDALRRQSAAAIADLSAVKLFVARASSASPGFTLDDDEAPAVAAICRRLDGLPLAIELAATWIRIFPPHEILRLLGSRLPLLSNGPRDLPERQRTMRATIDWSHHLLPPFEQSIFRRLAVFEGEIPLQAVTIFEDDADAGVDTPSPSLLMAVSALVDKSLLQRVNSDSSSPRFSMLETVREYALEQFATDPEAADVRARHAHWFLRFAEQTEARWQVPGDGSITAFLPEHDNLRAALSSFEESANAAEMLRLAAALGSFWLHTGHLREGLHWLERAVALGTRTGAPTSLISLAIGWRGVLSAAAGERDQARALLELAPARWQGAENWEGIAQSIEHLVRLDIASGDLDGAEVRINEAEVLFRRLHHHAGQSMALDTMAEIACMRRDFARAAQLSAEAVTAARRSGNRMRIALALVGSVQVEELVGSRERAIDTLREAATVARDVGFRFGVADAISSVASMIGPRVDPARAVRLLAAATAIREALAPDHFCHDGHYRQTLADSRGWLDPQPYLDAWEQGWRMDIELAIAEAWNGPATMGPTSTPEAGVKLSRREREVLSLLAQGKTNPEIADVLSISRKTVAVHVSNILGRLGVESRSAAVTAAIRAKLV